MVLDYYAVLEIPRGASTEDIKAAFKKMAKKWHPDMHSSESDKMRKYAEEMFKIAHQAYEGLLNGETSGEWNDSSGIGTSEQRQNGKQQTSQYSWQQSGSKSGNYSNTQKQKNKKKSEPQRDKSEYGHSYTELNTVQYVINTILSIQNPFLRIIAILATIALGALITIILWNVVVWLFGILIAVLTFLWHALLIAAVGYAIYKIAILII